MRLQIVSDLHVDHWIHRYGWSLWKAVDQLIPETDADAVVVAGDFGNWGIDASHFLEGAVWLEGNHDFYGGRIRHHEKSLARQRHSIDGQWFTGATLWHRDSTEARERMIQMADFTQIAMWKETVHHHSAIDVAWLEHALEPGDVLVTHHMPLQESIAPKYAGDPLNCLFMNDIRYLIFDRRPKLVVHGHTHERLDYMFGKTRVVCNPIGYPGENWAPGKRWPVEPMVVEI